jgi:hypothetical protein
VRLTALTFIEFPGRDAEWILEGLALSGVNLLVGKNATGKTRVLNVIDFLSRLLTGEQQEIITSGSFQATFEDGADCWQYSLVYNDFVVTREDLLLNGQNVLHRGEGGFGHILAVDIEGKEVKIKFSVPGPRVAVFTKLLQRKASASPMQLIMTTNDRFVMNSVPLDAWSVLVREGHKVRVLNYSNSRELFDEFKSTGLSNFSFLEMDFAHGPQRRRR